MEDPPQANQDQNDHTILNAVLPNLDPDGSDAGDSAGSGASPVEDDALEAGDVGG